MIKLGVILGGKSTENKISVMSGTAVLNNLNKNKYDIYPIFIDENGDWYNYDTNEKINDIVRALKNLDVVFPVLHGLYGEDGTIQGMLEMIGIPYVGCKVLASSVGMDKAYTKIVFEKAGINQAKYIYVKKFKNQDKFLYIDDNFDEKLVTMDELIKIIKAKISYPMFVKPSNSGSSVGVNKAEDDTQLIENIKMAAEFDTKILIEQGIYGKEIECAVLGNSEIGVQVTDVGEILPAEEFYSFNAKYNDSNSRTLIPARITDEQSEKIKNLAVKAFKAIDGNGLSRVDFFVENDSGKIFINEINTMPGFTDISMYPKLFEAFGISFSELLDRLIEMEI